MFAIRRFDKNRPIEFGPWQMGKIGFTVNVLAIAFCIFLIIFLPFPPELPVTDVNMNYASVVFIGVMAYAILDYFIRGRGKYVGPIKEVGSESSSEVVRHSDVPGEKI